MATMIGTIERIDQRSAKTKWGMKPVYSVVIAGQPYSTNFQKPSFNVGDCVKFEFTIGKYGNDVVKDTMQLSPVAIGPGVAQVGGQTMQRYADAVKPGAPIGNKSYQERTFPVGALSPERAIIRQNALTNARELFCACISTPGSVDLDLAKKKIVEVARYFESYSAGDLDVEEVKAEDRREA